MSIYNEIKVGSAVPIHEDYKAKKQARSFWDISYELPTRYIDASDARGEPILPAHACEDKRDYKQRQSMTKPRAYVQQVINQFNSFLFSNEISRSGVPQDLIDNADLEGNSLDELMRDACIMAQVKGGAILVPDSTMPQEGMSVEQARQADVRPFITVLDIDAVINWSDYGDELILIFDGYIRYMNAEFYQDFAIQKNNRNNLKIVSAGEPVSHGYGMLPLSWIRPKLWKDSQAAKISDIQQTIVNLQSILQVELRNKTFSHHVLAGDFDIDPDQPVKIGQGKATILQTSGNGITPTIQVLGGADVSQADSLRTSLKEEVNELYRTAGLSSPEPLTTQAPESGIAKIVEFNKTESIVKALADACEAAENKLWELFGINGNTNYPDSFAPEPVQDKVEEEVVEEE